MLYNSKNKTNIKNIDVVIVYFLRKVWNIFETY